MIHTGDCIAVMAAMEPDSVDAVVTDPPYGLEFMGKAWDKFDRHGPASFENLGPEITWRPNAARAASVGSEAPNGASPFLDKPRFGTMGPKALHAFQAWCEAWGREALRVTKPGGYLLAFGGTRTHHRLVCGLEDAGWIIRDELTWVYASGFPKGKANLKPAHEPIVLARKPGPLRPLAIDECRIAMEPYTYPTGPKGNVDPSSYNFGRIETPVEGHPAGRWPSNLLLSDPELFDEPNSYVIGSGATATSGSRTGEYDGSGAWSGPFGPVSRDIEGDAGGYSRFFIIPKADRSDREPIVRPEGHEAGKRFSIHPTMKPTDLMRHLVRLVTPSGGTVLDPFLGSGSTAIACEMEGFPWIGIEKEPEYVKIAEARLNGTQRGLGLDTPLVGEPRKSVDGVAVRRNVGISNNRKIYQPIKRTEPMPDVGYGSSKSKRESSPAPPGMFDEEPAA